MPLQMTYAESVARHRVDADMSEDLMFDVSEHYREMAYLGVHLLKGFKEKVSEFRGRLEAEKSELESYSTSLLTKAANEITELKKHRDEQEIQISPTAR